MQYNKYAFALVLLASSAFASTPFSESKYVTLSAEVLKVLKGDKTLSSEKSETLNSLSAAQKKQLMGSADLNASTIKYNLQFADALAILSKARDGPISQKDSQVYDNLLTRNQYDLIAEFELSSTLRADEIVEFLDKGILPPLSGAETVSKLQSLPGGEDPLKPKSIEQTPDQIGEEKKLKKKEEKDKKENEELEKKEKEKKELKDQEIATKIISALGNVEDFSILTSDVYNTLELSSQQVKALQVTKVTKETNAAEIVKLLNNPEKYLEKLAPGTPKSAEEQAKAMEQVKVMEKAKSILKLVEGDIRLSTLKDIDFKGLATAEQIAAIKSKETETKVQITVEELIEILNASPKNPKVDLNGSAYVGFSNSSESKLWEKPLLWGIVGVAIVLAIGGGAYMMTRKTEETDL